MQNWLLSFKATCDQKKTILFYIIQKKALSPEFGRNFFLG